jgi:hypothetical protein
MAKVFDGIDDRLRDWIARQHVFFVGSAPLAGDGHVNVSPKGPIGTLRVLDEHTVAYLDLVGSGAETVAHLQDNGRIVVMLCAFEGPPRIVRLHGRASVLLPGETRFAELLKRFDPPEDALRSLIHIDVDRVADSCGYGVPLLEYRSDRDVLDRYWAKPDKDPAAYNLYRIGGERGAWQCELISRGLTASGEVAQQKSFMLSG